MDETFDNIKVISVHQSIIHKQTEQSEFRNLPELNSSSSLKAISVTSIVKQEIQSNGYKKTYRLQEVSIRKSKSPRSYAKQTALVTSAEFEQKIKLQREKSKEDGPPI